jgi:16S rRNA (adenine1518-N6/adenine1519-N6)-dimethyltransferase
VLSGIRPQKRLGQHFLRDRSIAERIIQSMSIGCEDRILEIGAGEGVLTERLIDSPAQRIVAVELDARLAEWLKRRFEEHARIEIVEADFLKLDLGVLFSGERKIRGVGNIPYAITTPILFRLLDGREKVRDMTVTLQKEVGERITSPPGCKAYGIPSVLFQLHSRIDVLFSIPRKAFYPVPKVDSIVLRFQFLDRPLYDVEDPSFFRRVVKTAFGQRRKMLKNTLKSLVMDEKRLQDIPFDLHRRPEELSVADFAVLSNALFRYTPQEVSWKKREPHKII